MQRSNSKPRSGGFEKAQRGSVSSPLSKNSSISSSPSSSAGSKVNKAKTMPVSSDSSESKRVRERKSPARTAPLQEKKSIKIAEMQQQISQLQEELKREKEEKTQAMEELAETKKMLSLSKQANITPIKNIQSLQDSMNQVETWEREIEKAKDSERRMLESLIFQTKQLEQTKISLEEAKLTIRSLNNKEDEVNTLKIRLKSALESEEKSKKAMDDLAIALNDVSDEAKQIKCWLSETESELQKTRTESEMLKSAMANLEGEFKLVSDENDQLKFEKDELVSAWNEKEKLFINCMKQSETELNKAKSENLKLTESQRVIRDENSRLRDILKQAVNESNLVKENLEMEKKENSNLKKQISDKEKAFQTVKQDYECLKVSERSARDSLIELENMLDTKPTPIATPSPKTKEEKEEKEEEAVPEMTQKNRRHSIGEPSKFGRFNQSERFAHYGPPDSKSLVYASLSNVCDMTTTTNAVVQEMGGEYDYIDGDHFAGADQYVNVRHKKKPILRRFGDIFRRKSIHGTGY